MHCIPTKAAQSHSNTCTAFLWKFSHFRKSHSIKKAEKRKLEINCTKTRTNRMAAEFTVVSAQSYVNLTIYTSLNAFGVEKRFGKDILIADLKNKLEMITGLQSGFMTIKLLSREKKFLCDLDDDSKMLGKSNDGGLTIKE